MKHVTPSMIVSVVLSLLVVLWVKMTLNGMHPRIPETKKKASGGKLEQPEEPSGADTSVHGGDEKAASVGPPEPLGTKHEVTPPQPPPTQLRQTMHWEPHMPAPMTVGRTLIQVEPDPMVEDEGAFEHGE